MIPNISGAASAAQIIDPQPELDYESLSYNVTRCLNQQPPQSQYLQHQQPLNENHMIRFGPLLFILEKLKPQSEWLQLGLVVVNTQATQKQQLSRIKIRLNYSSGQEFKLIQKIYRKARLQLLVNPCHDGDWALIIRGSHFQRMDYLFVTRFMTVENMAPQTVNFMLVQNSGAEVITKIAWHPNADSIIFVLDGQNLVLRSYNYGQDLDSPLFTLRLDSLLQQHRSGQYIDMAIVDSQGLQGTSVLLLYSFGNHQKELHYVGPIIVASQTLSKIHVDPILQQQGEIDGGSYAQALQKLFRSKYVKLESVGAASLQTKIHSINYEYFSLLQLRVHKLQNQKGWRYTSMFIAKGLARTVILLPKLNILRQKAPAVDCYKSTHNLNRHNTITKICTFELPLQACTTNSQQIAARIIDQHSQYIFVLSLNRLFRLAIGFIDNINPLDDYRFDQTVQQAQSSLVLESNVRSQSDLGFRGFYFNQKMVACLRTISNQEGERVIWAFEILNNDLKFNSQVKKLGGELNAFLEDLKKSMKQPPPPKESLARPKINIAGAATCEEAVMRVNEYLVDTSRYIERRQKEIAELQSELENRKKGFQRKHFQEKSLGERIKRLSDGNLRIRDKIEALKSSGAGQQPAIKKKTISQQVDELEAEVRLTKGLLVDCRSSNRQIYASNTYKEEVSRLYDSVKRLKQE